MNKVAVPAACYFSEIRVLTDLKNSEFSHAMLKAVVAQELIHKQIRH